GWLFPSLYPFVIVLGILPALPLFKQAYDTFVARRRLSMLHVAVIYIAAMWLRGYYIVAILAATAGNMSRKVMFAVEDQSRERLINVFGQQPRTVWVQVDGAEMEIPFEEVRIDDIVVLNAGQMAPIDGSIIEGIASIDQHMLTGEAQPVEKTVGAPVLASTVVLAGRIAVRVEKTGAETTGAQIGEILNRTANFRLALETEVRELGDRMVLPTLAVSALSIPLIGLNQAAVLLGSNFTVTMLVLGPVTMLNFLNIASQRGILVKDGRSLERLDNIDTIVFDKTGTLTIEQPHVAHIHTYNGMADTEVLTLAAAAEYRQTHPIAQAILAAADERQLQLPEIDHAQYEIGYGIKVQMADHLVHVGSQRFMAMEGIELPVENEALQAYSHEQGHSLVLVAVDHELAGGVELQPTVRPEAKRIVQDLRERGFSLYIISGDHEGPTRKLATDLGIPGYFANTLPDQKSDLVKQLQDEGRRVCFIGDGINDALAMRQAEVSISLRGATTAATDTAQVVLMDASLNQLLHLFDIAQGFNNTRTRIFKTAIGLSVFCATGVFFLNFNFAMAEILLNVSGMTGLGMAMKPLLDHKKDIQRQQALTEGDKSEALVSHAPDGLVGLLQEPGVTT
ncbi:MAG: heavy metal translocating P-type ATPase, partial [Candidatus Tectomicrobia bacterium]|nr:heavy metal translocating P-type ATPase [Candidatus Tectomicrobia bacterium]